MGVPAGLTVVLEQVGNRPGGATLPGEPLLELARAARSAVALGKPAFYRQAELSLADAYAHTAEVMVHNMDEYDANEGIDAFIQKRAPVWAD